METNVRTSPSMRPMLLLIAQVDAGNSWFQPVIGYSLPVFLTILLTFGGVWTWSRYQERASK